MISRTTEVTGFFAGCCAQTMTADSNIRQVLEARFMRPPILLLNLPESGTNSCATQHKQNVPAKDDCKSSAALHFGASRKTNGSDYQRPNHEDVQRCSEGIEHMIFRRIQEVSRIRGHRVLEGEGVSIHPCYDRDHRKHGLNHQGKTGIHHRRVRTLETKVCT